MAIKSDLAGTTVHLYDCGSHWFAQSVEVDYFAQGKDREDVVLSFIRGWCGTINLNMERFGHLRGFLAPTPSATLEDLGEPTETTSVFEMMKMVPLPTAEAQ